jgi:hypothetical protein
MQDIIKNMIDKFDRGYVFTANDFSEIGGKPAEIARTLNNLANEGYMCKLAKGKYYKPFGQRKLKPYQAVKDLLIKNGKQVGYITGPSIFNRFKLTTQTSDILQIGSCKGEKPGKRGTYQVIFVSQPNSITAENVRLLQWLDCLRFFKIIPNATPDDICKRLIELLAKLTKARRHKLKRLALKYPPRTIALLGAMLEALNDNEDTRLLHRKLHPMTRFKFFISPEILPTKEKWHIE